MTEPPEGWGPVLTIKVRRAGTLWAAWTDDVHGVLVHGHSLAEVLQKFPAAKAEVERALAEGVVEAEPHGDRRIEKIARAIAYADSEAFILASSDSSELSHATDHAWREWIPHALAVQAAIDEAAEAEPHG
jgi:hypothetical protein